MEFISSFFDNIKEKTTNPFFGTLIFVWLVRNWELVFTFFNFDKDCTLDNKKEFIRAYYHGRNIWEDGSINMVIALGLLILGYGLVVISRLVVNVTNHNIIPRMNEKTVSKLVVSKARFETVKKARDEYYIKIEDLGEKVIDLEQKNSLLRADNIKLDADLKATSNEYSILNMKHDVLQEVNDQQKVNLNNYKLENEKLIDNNKIISEEINKLLESNMVFDNQLGKLKLKNIENNNKIKLLDKDLDPVLYTIYKELRRKGIDKDFFTVSESIINNRNMINIEYDSKLLDELHDLKLIKTLSKNDKFSKLSEINLQLTDLGIKLMKNETLFRITYDYEYNSK